MKKLILLVVGIFIVSNVFAQKEQKNTEIVIIQTSAVCEDCKERIETALNYLKGVVYAELDLKTKKVTVKYKLAKVTLDQLKQKIAETGYDAGDVKATGEGLSKLPACCKPGGMD